VEVGPNTGGPGSSVGRGKGWLVRKGPLISANHDERPTQDQKNSYPGRMFLGERLRRTSVEEVGWGRMILKPGRVLNNLEVPKGGLGFGKGKWAISG